MSKTSPELGATSIITTLLIAGAIKPEDLAAAFAEQNEPQAQKPEGVSVGVSRSLINLGLLAALATTAVDCQKSNDTGNSCASTPRSPTPEKQKAPLFNLTEVNLTVETVKKDGNIVFTEKSFQNIPRAKIKIRNFSGISCHTLELENGQQFVYLPDRSKKLASGDQVQFKPIISLTVPDSPKRQYTAVFRAFYEGTSDEFKGKESLQGSTTDFERLGIHEVTNAGNQEYAYVGMEDDTNLVCFQSLQGIKPGDHIDFIPAELFFRIKKREMEKARMPYVDPTTEKDSKPTEPEDQSKQNQPTQAPPLVPEATSPEPRTPQPPTEKTVEKPVNITPPDIQPALIKDASGKLKIDIEGTKNRLELDGWTVEKFINERGGMGFTCTRNSQTFTIKSLSDLLPKETPKGPINKLEIPATDTPELQRNLAVFLENALNDSKDNLVVLNIDTAQSDQAREFQPNFEKVAANYSKDPSKKVKFLQISFAAAMNDAQMAALKNFCNKIGDFPEFISNEIQFFPLQIMIKNGEVYDLNGGAEAINAKRFQGRIKHRTDNLPPKNLRKISIPETGTAAKELLKNALADIEKKSQEHLVVVYTSSAKGCQPCKMTSPDYPNIAKYFEDRNDVEFVILEFESMGADTGPLKDFYGKSGLKQDVNWPMQLFVKNGKVVRFRRSGADIISGEDEISKQDKHRVLQRKDGTTVKIYFEDIIEKCLAGDCGSLTNAVDDWFK